MKYLKILGLAAIAAAALMAFAGSASATVLTSPAGTKLPAGTVVHAEAESIVKLAAGFGNIECEESTISGKTGQAEAPEITGAIETLTFGKCNCTVAVLKTGSLGISVSTSPNGSVKGTGSEVTTSCFGLHCIWTTNGTSLGTLTGSPNATTDATFDISAQIPRSGGTGGAFCGKEGTWSGSYKITQPTPLIVD